MANRAVKLLPAILASIVLCVLVVTIPLGTTDAAEECLTTPKNETPSGQHWYYQTERGTKRHCWFLREESEYSSRAATSTLARRAAPGATRENKTLVTPSTAGAHAELLMPQIHSEKDLEVSPTTPAPLVNPEVYEQGLPDNASAKGSQRSLVTSRWPETEDTLASAITPPITLAAVSVAEPNPGATTERTPAAPSVPLGKATLATSASLQTLILVILGALTVVGLSGGAIYRLAYARRGLQHHDSLHHEPNLQSTDHSRVQQWLEPNLENPSRRASVQRAEHIESDLEDNLRQIEKLHFVSGGALITLDAPGTGTTNFATSS